MTDAEAVAGVTARDTATERAESAILFMVEGFLEIVGISSYQAMLNST
ncbi:MAG: hypothetical protein IPK39_09705 [Sulfuritalea sp.]|nr:hypothetical protein [Sulfuritalea sp.]